MSAERLIWILPMVGLLVVLIGAIYLNLTRPRKHADVDELADRRRADEVNEQERQRAQAKEKLWLRKIDNHVLRAPRVI